MDYKEVNNGDFERKPPKKKLPKVLIIVLILILTNFATFILAIKLPINGTVRISKEAYDEISKFDKLFVVKNNIDTFYDGKIDETAMIDAAIKGMTNSLGDPYTVYMDKEEYEKFNGETSGTYVGIGIQLDVKDNKIVVVAPFDGSPAKDAGIVSGDIIEKVDGKKVDGKKLTEAISMMRGKEDTEVVLTIKRNTKAAFDVKLKRKEIPLITVKGEMIDGSIGYVQISIFDEHTSDQFKDEIDKLKKQGMKGMILDLRQNPGGWLTECINITSNFLQKDKLIVSTKDKNGNEEKLYSKGGELIGLPLVVLVDEGSASASEIFSGAIRDYKVGTLIGTKTFGKGIVQSVLDKSKFGFGDGTALKVTTSKYYTPNGENIHHIGIKPDITVQYPKELLGKTYERSKDPQFNTGLKEIREKIKSNQ